MLSLFCILNFLDLIVNNSKKSLVSFITCRWINMFTIKLILPLIFLFVFLVSVSQSRSRIKCVCGKSFLNQRIWLGRFSIPHQYPWQVVLLKNAKMICSGAMLNERWVISASHCLLNVTIFNLFLNYGCNHKLIPLEKRKTEKIILHEHFSGMEILDNDISLIKNDKRVEMNEKIIPICLPSANMPFPAMFEAVGWGLTEDLDYPDYLKYTIIPLRTRAHCENSWGELYNFASKFCAGYQTGTCGGDSGGSLIARQKGLYFIEGIVSFGYSTCGFPEYPPVYTKIRYFLTWINKHLADDDYCQPLQD